MRNNLNSNLVILVSVMVLSSCGYEQVRRLPDENGLSSFAEVPLRGGKNAWEEKFHPFVGATPIDVNADGHLEIFVGGGDGYDDMLFSYQNGELVNIIDGTGLSDSSATHGANSTDLDGDGDTDLLLSRADGVFIYENNDGIFSRRRIDVNLPSDSAPLNVAVGDIDGDGDGDLYVSTFVDLANFRSATFNDPSHAKTNILLRNDGGFNFVDITESSGTASLQNTFLASFIDLDSDKRLDLVVAQNTGQVEIFRNLGDNKFESRAVKTGWGFWMGLAAGDIDGDGDQDLFFTNSGTSVPGYILEQAGDGTDDQPRNYGWILLRNEGDFEWTDITSEYELDDYGFAWGAVFEDLTLDGELELLVSQNYIKWPPHRWLKLANKSFVQRDGAFYHAPALGLEHQAFSQSPLITDINNDGRPDVFWADMEGVGRAFVNRSDNNFITLLFEDAPSTIGTRAYVVTSEGKSHERILHNNTGMSTDQWTGLTFGLGKIDEVKEVVVEWPDGMIQTLPAPTINEVISVRR